MTPRPPLPRRARSWHGSSGRPAQPLLPTAAPSLSRGTDCGSPGAWGRVSCLRQPGGAGPPSPCLSLRARGCLRGKARTRQGSPRSALGTTRSVLPRGRSRDRPSCRGISFGPAAPLLPSQDGPSSAMPHLEDPGAPCGQDAGGLLCRGSWRTNPGRRGPQGERGRTGPKRWEAGSAGLRTCPPRTMPSRSGPGLGRQPRLGLGAEGKVRVGTGESLDTHLPLSPVEPGAGRLAQVPPT